MGRGSYNGGGSLVYPSEFDYNEMGSPPRNWRSNYLREVSEVRFAQNLSSWLVRRQLELETLVKQDASFGLELDRVKLFLSDPQAHLAEARAYILGPSDQSAQVPKP